MLATGSTPAPERLGGPVDGSIPVLSIDEAVGRSTFSGDVLFVDLRGDLESALTAEHVAAAGGTHDRHAVPQSPAEPRLHAPRRRRRAPPCLGAAIESSTAFGGIVRRRGGHAAPLLAASCSSRPFDLVVAGVAGRSDTSLAAAAEQAGVRLLVAGDAVAPRTALHAFREGDDVGRAV